MTTTSAKPPILTRALLLRFVSAIAASVSFFLPLAVIPMYAGTAGTATAAGLANGVLLVATVVGELVTPRLIALIGYRWSLAVGLVLLGAPAFALLGAMSFSTIFVVGVLRGIGFAITVVAGGALTAGMIPEERRGEGLAVVGLVVGIPSLVTLPLGVWMANHWGFGIVFVLTAVFPLAAVVTVFGLPDRVKSAGGQHGVLAGLRNGALTRPAVIFAASAAAAGVVVTYLPLATVPWVAPIALFVQPTAATIGRWVAGKIGDRHGQVPMLVPSVGLAILGVVGMAVTNSPALVIAGAATFGVGFGVLQNASISLMYSRVPAGGYSTVSAIWNAAYDLGMAVGSIGVGVIVTATSLPTAFVITAATMVPVLLMSWREGRLPLGPRS